MRIAIALLVLAIPLRAAAIDFDQLRIYATGGKSATSWHGQADLQALNVEVASLVRPRTELAIVLAPTTIWQPRSWFGDQYGNGNETVSAVSTSLLGRQLFNADSSRVTYYAELGGGPLWAQKMVPAATSHLNFMTQVGLGVVLRPRSRFPIVAGARFYHISNGGSSSRNPGLNVTSAVLGVRVQK